MTNHVVSTRLSPSQRGQACQMLVWFSRRSLLRVSTIGFGSIAMIL